MWGFPGPFLLIPDRTGRRSDSNGSSLFKKSNHSSIQGGLDEMQEAQ